MDKRLIEAILFAVGKRISEKDIAKLINEKSIPKIRTSLKQIKKDYEARNSPMVVMQEGELWKLTIREEFMPIIQKLITNIELSRSVMKTLAVIAWRAPIIQSDLADIRGSGIYDHVSELEDKGFIEKERYGRSYIIKLTSKFYEYFDIDGREQAKELFKNFAKHEKELQEDIESYNKKEPDHLGKLEVYDTSEPESHIISPEKRSDNPPEQPSTLPEKYPSKDITKPEQNLPKTKNTKEEPEPDLSDLDFTEEDLANLDLSEVQDD